MPYLDDAAQLGGEGEDAVGFWERCSEGFLNEDVNTSLKELPHFEVFRKAGFALIFMVAAASLMLFIIWRNPTAVSRWVEKRLAKFPAAARAACVRIRTFSEGLKAIHDWKSFVQLLSLSTGIWLLIALVYVLVTTAYPDLKTDMTIPYVLLLMSASIAGSILQLPVVGGGSQLGTIGVLTEVFDVEEELAASAGIMLWLVTFMAIVPIGLLLARREHVSLRKLSEVADPDVV